MPNQNRDRRNRHLLQNDPTIRHDNATLAEKVIAFADDRFWVLTSFILFAALTVRVIALYQLKQTPYYDFLLWDERIYHEWAKQIADGSYKPLAAYEFSPLPAYVMALIYWLFSPDVHYIRILNICFGLITCLFIALIGKQIGGRCIGLVAGLIAATYAPFILYSIVPLKTALSVMLCTVVIFFLTVEVQQPTLIKASLMGAFLGLAINVRGNYNVLAVIGFAAVYWSTRKSRPNLAATKEPFVCLACFLSALFLFMAPFAARNYMIAGEFIPSTTQSGFNFYIGNTTINKDPYYRPLPFASNSPFKQGPQFTIEASRRAGKAMSAREASRYWYKEAFKEALKNPTAYLSRLVRKAAAVLNRFEAADHYDIDFLSRFVPIFSLPMPTFTVVWPLGLAGLIIGVVTQKRLGWLLSAFVAYAGTLVMFYSSARYRAPLVAILIPFVPFGLGQVANCLRHPGNKKNLVTYVVVLTAFALIEFIPLHAANDRTAYYNTHAFVLYNTGEEQEALHYWENSFRMNGFFSPSAALSLAQVYAQRGNFEQALRYLAAIPDSSYQSAAKYQLLGDIFQLQDHIKKAVSAYQRSLQINSGELSVYQKLVRLLSITDPTASLALYKKMQQLSNYYTGM